MEQKFEKSFREKFGDFYSKMGRRALFSLGCIGFGILLELVLPDIGIGYAITSLSIYNLISICEKEKTKYLKSVPVMLPNGKMTSCALFEQRFYAHAPLIMAFFSPGFYIPYKTQYILVRNMEAKNLAPGTRVPPPFLKLGLINIEIIPKSKYSAIMKNPQILSDELYAQKAPRRKAFLREINPFVATGLLEEIYHTDKLSICRLFDNKNFILFHYESHSGVQCGLYIKEEHIKKIKEDDSFLLESYIYTKNPSVTLLSNELLERLLRYRKNQNTENTDIKNTFEAKDDVEARYIDKVNKNKKVFTREMIASKLKSKKCTWRMVWGIILLYFSVGGFCLTVGGICSGTIILTVIGLPLWILLMYFGVKNIKISNKNRRTLTTGQYKIIKTTCTERLKETQTDSDGNSCGYSYSHFFSNGDALILGYTVAVEGDEVYLVYLNDNEKISAFYNAIEYVPADDLVVTECL